MRMKLPGDAEWSLGMCKEEVGPRSYLVECGGRTYRQNCQHLRTTQEKLPITTQSTPDAEIEDTVSESGDADKPMDLESSISSGDSTPSNNDVDQILLGLHN